MISLRQTCGSTPRLRPVGRTPIQPDKTPLEAEAEEREAEGMAGRGAERVEATAEVGETEGREVARVDA